MLKSLQIKNFRALEDFTVYKLGRVNLVVGKNNSGKSSVLEALRIYAGNAQISLLESIAADHDERYRSKDSEVDDADSSQPFEEFFTGRHYPEIDGVSIQIGELDSDQLLQIEHALYVEQREEDEDGEGNTITQVRRKRVPKTISNLFGEAPNHALVISKGDKSTMLRFDAYRNRNRPSPLDLPGIKPCGVIPTQFISIDELADEWDKIALTESQEVVKGALKLISPDFLDIAFVRNEDRSAYFNRTTSRRDLSRSAKVQLANHDRPVPLGSLGDGMLRVLQLVLKVFSAKGGFLLIDEFENGLHFSVQEKVWALIFELAHKLDIQVFATTHSWDCIESFANVAREREDIEGVLFRVGRSTRMSEKGRVIATVFDEEQLFGITQSDVEVR